MTYLVGKLGKTKSYKEEEHASQQGKVLPVLVPSTSDSKTLGDGKQYKME